MRSVYIETYGCQMNLADTELLFGHLGQHGYQRTTNATDADVILLNTCAIREHAEERVLSRLGELVRHKARRPDVLLGVAGCMAQHVRDRLQAKIPFVDFVVGPDAYRRLPELLGGAAGDPLVDVRLDRAETYADIVPQRDAGVRAWVTIMRGCDKFCTFCIVPYVRGRERSLPADAIVDQVRQLAGAGYREIVFLGQTVNAYRDGAVDFAELLRRTNAVAGIERIRFTSPHPSDMTEAVIDAMASCHKVCPQLHLPVQSGSDRILASMERGHTVAEYLDLVQRLRRAVPGIALTTDVIVGFPGEEEADFLATCALMREVGYHSAFMFKYSARSGTKAFKWPETVCGEEKGRRLQTIIALQEERSAAINRTLIGSTTEVLVEGPARRRDGWHAGKSPQFKTVVFPADGTKVGDLAQVRVTDATAHTLVGTSPGKQ
ncbi:MAG TPA: tRNA (N6-isopentenyl adenosine(37)-C2)-methylthiotransferase MiaB [Candidatus Binatia bacterium]